METQIIQITNKAHEEFLVDLEKTEEINTIFRDPISCKMWHHKFNPHTNEYIKDITMA